MQILVVNVSVYTAIIYCDVVFVGLIQLVLECQIWSVFKYRI